MSQHVSVCLWILLYSLKVYWELKVYELKDCELVSDFTEYRACFAAKKLNRVTKMKKKKAKVASRIYYISV
jgi:hypothetical protein